ncbi:SulP family inorganic anion transporter [Methylobacter tundripaludum]|uniref:Sulfate transporter n=1 Tax=Methylobacter tundripaludum (strain ATCC BAA-1195 / DSM 17260 / SV96) TaxID=697282 RepID=G3IZR7_METTV|nr:sulfate permease [Methylobacter tundripaludum]EGW20439.1 sulfate transporter [Methylobacter tundripaludum SV96]
MPHSQSNNSRLTQLFPIAGWLKSYTRQEFNSDVFAGIITAILLVPQGIAYAILAGLPPQLGLYASILPPVLYALLGTSRTLSVGPVSIAAIMIASALTAPEISALGNPVQSALILSAESGIIMLLMALLRMGGLVNFISHPVLTGFTSGAALLIIGSQLPQLLGLKTPSCGVDVICYSHYFSGLVPVTLLIGLAAIGLLVFFGKPLVFILKNTGMQPYLITAISKCGPLLTIMLATLAVGYFDLTGQQNVAVVGQVPSGFPALNMDFSPIEKWYALLPYSGFIALIAYVESVAIAKVTANFRNEKIIPNQELIALGVANLAAAVSGGMPVAGGFSRTMVNFAAGARTQMAMLIAAGLLALAVIFFSPLFENIPKAALAAIILVAIIPLVKLSDIAHTWRYDRGDGIAETATLLGVLVYGIEEGITLGIILTLISHLRKTSQPHIAVVGRIPGTEHYRNIKRHSVETWPHLLLLRVDESITFANINYIEEFINAELRRQPNLKHIVLIFTSISDIDTTALEVLENLNHTLQASKMTLHISEAKGPVLDKLEKTDFLRQLKPGKAFFHTEDAVRELAKG